MNENKGYNGWNNYETWNVALWIDNEESTYREARDMVREAFDDTDADQEHEERVTEATGPLAKRLEEWVDEMKPDLGASMFSDLLNAALSEVDWYEIAENWLSEIEPEEKR